MHMRATGCYYIPVYQYQTAAGSKVVRDKQLLTIPCNND